MKGYLVATHLKKRIAKKIIDYSIISVYNYLEVHMTMNNLISFEPISTDGKVLIDKAVFDEMKRGYISACVLADLAESEKEILEGKVFTADEVFAGLKAKYGY